MEGARKTVTAIAHMPGYGEKNPNFYFSNMIGNIRFITITSGIVDPVWDSNKKLGEYFIMKDFEKWLTDQFALAKINNEWVVVITHIPLFLSAGYKLCNKAQAYHKASKAMRETFLKDFLQNVNVLITAHVHAYSRFDPMTTNAELVDPNTINPHEINPGLTMRPSEVEDKEGLNGYKYIKMTYDISQSEFSMMQLIVGTGGGESFQEFHEPKKDLTGVVSLRNQVGVVEFEWKHSNPDMLSGRFVSVEGGGVLDEFIIIDQKKRTPLVSNSALNADYNHIPEFNLNTLSLKDNPTPSNNIEVNPNYNSDQIINLDIDTQHS
jgi:hypothetical protein